MTPDEKRAVRRCFERLAQSPNDLAYIGDDEFPWATRPLRAFWLMEVTARYARMRAVRCGA